MYTPFPLSLPTSCHPFQSQLTFPASPDLPELLPAAPDYLESPVSDGTIEENFEAELGGALVEEAESALHHTFTEDDDFTDIAQHGIVDIVGDDTYGRKVIVVSACKLPSNKVFNHEKFLK